MDKIGEGEGKGYNINIAFDTNPKEGVSYFDNDIIYIFERVLFPIISEFGAEFILFSCGLDALKGDQIGQQ